MIRITLAECRLVYESYFGKDMPKDMPYSVAAQKVIDELGSVKFRALLTKLRKERGNPYQNLYKGKLTTKDYRGIFVEKDKDGSVYMSYENYWTRVSSSDARGHNINELKNEFAERYNQFHDKSDVKKFARGTLPDYVPYESSSYKKIMDKIQKSKDNPARTPAQQKLFAIALGIKKGQIARSYSAEAAKMADRMSVRKLEEFARTRFNPSSELPPSMTPNEKFVVLDIERNLNKVHIAHKGEIICGVDGTKHEIDKKYVFDYFGGKIHYFMRVCKECERELLYHQGNPLQQNLLPELGAAVLAGAGLGLGYKSVNAAWNKVTGKKNPVNSVCIKCDKPFKPIYLDDRICTTCRNKRNFGAHCSSCGRPIKKLSDAPDGYTYCCNRRTCHVENYSSKTCSGCGANIGRWLNNPQADDKPDPKGQTCPKCGKVYHDYKWGGTGKCECGHYFHPDWYGRKGNPIKGGVCAQCGSTSLKLYDFSPIYLKLSQFDGFVGYTCKSCKHKGEFLYKLVKKTNPGEAYHVDRAAMFEGFARNSGVAALSRQAKRMAESERHNAKMSQELGIPNPVSHKVHPKAFVLRDMYRGDVKAGHTEAADYWRGGAAALFTDGNPRRGRKR